MDPDHFVKIKKILVDELAVDEDEVIPEAHLGDDLDADSYNRLLIFSEVEKLFGIKISDKTAPSIKKVEDLMKIVEE